ncbi:MAG: DNA-binding protein [Paramuribaculum sp.]|nr:DNA-binding protein [Paramuribaculum sp.]
MAKKSPSSEKAQKSFLLRLDSPTMAMVEEWAASEFRSVNGQLQWIVNESLRRHRRLKKQSGANRPDTTGDDAGDNSSTHDAD